MFNYKVTLEAMKRERASMQAEVTNSIKLLLRSRRWQGIRFLLPLGRDFRRKVRGPFPASVDPRDKSRQVA